MTDDGNTNDDQTYQDPRTGSKQTGVQVQLSGEDGNAFAIIARARRAMRRAGVSQDIIDAYTAEATSGNYDNVLLVTMQYCDVD